MDIHKNFHRRIRIEGKPDAVEGYLLTVSDAQTGELIANVKRVAVLLDVMHDNKAIITYHEKDESGKLVVKDHEPVERTVTVDNPELSVTAYDVNEDVPNSEINE